MTEFTKLDEFPELYAKSLRLSKGIPRGFAITKYRDVIFLRSCNDEGSLGIWIAKNENNIVEKLLINPNDDKFSSDKEESQEVKALKERLRDTSSGISSFQYNDEESLIVFSINGSTYVYSLISNSYISTFENISLSLLSPNGRYLAICENNAVKIYSYEDNKIIHTIKKDNFVWGISDFISMEEMSRYVSCWFSPDSKTFVSVGHNQDELTTTSIQPSLDDEAKEYKYPFAGSLNPTLIINICELGQDDEFFDFNEEYLINVIFDDENSPLAISQNREQNYVTIYKIETNKKQYEYDEKRQFDIFSHIPKELRNNSWLHYMIDPTQDKRVLAIDESPIIGTAGLVSVLGFSKSYLYFEVLENGFDLVLKRLESRSLNAREILEHDLTEIIVKSGAPTTLALSSKHDDYVITSRSDSSMFPETKIIVDNASMFNIFQDNSAIDFNFDVSCEYKTYFNNIHGLIIKPKNIPGPLPLIVHSYGGPSSYSGGHYLRFAIKNKSRQIFSQYLAALGFIVVAIDGAGTPSNSVSKEDENIGNFFDPPVNDQVKVVEQIIKDNIDIDKNNIGITGWSFGGSLAAGCISKCPDLFKAAIIGAEVADWRLYDTHYTEKYLGNPNFQKDYYDKSSLLNKTFDKNSKIRLVHGRSDDNVLFENSLQLLNHLESFGVDVEFDPIDGTTHMPAKEDVIKKLAIDDVSFFIRNLKTS